MSFEALRWVRDLRAKPLQKLLLWALGDAAGEHGVAWPSITALRLWTGLSERAVQRTLRELVAGGVLEVVAGGGRGRTTRYRLLVGAALQTQSVVRGKGATPAAGRGLQGATPANVRGLRGETPSATQGFVPESPSLLLPLPRKTPPDSRGCSVETPAVSHPEPPESNPGEGVSGGRVGTRAAARAARGGRLPADWQPDADDRAFAEALGLDVEWVAGQFRDYWCDKPGAAGVRIRWHGTWRVWCRKEVEEGRGQRGGVGAPSRRGRGQAEPKRGERYAYLRRSIFDPAPAEDDGPQGPIIDMAVGE